MIKVKSQAKEEYGTTIVEDGQLVKKSMPQVIEEIEKETGLNEIKSEGDFALYIENERLDKDLEMFKGAVKVIKSKMELDQHYMILDGVEKPILLQAGAYWIATATRMNVDVELTEKHIDYKNNDIFYEYKGTASWKGNRSVSVYKSCHSKEFNMRAVWDNASSKKTIYDVRSNVSSMAQKRAKVAAIKELIAMTDAFETNEDNPKATKRRQMAVYQLFYKHFSKYMPVAPKKKKMKNGKFKQYTEKEKLNWQKDFIKSKYFTPRILEMGIPSFPNWGIKDVEKLEEEIPTWPKRFMELSQKEIEEKHTRESIEKNAEKE